MRERLSEASLFLGLAYNDHGVGQACMGLASGDVRGFQKDDILVANYEDDTNTLYLAEDGGFCVDAKEITSLRVEWPSGLHEQFPPPTVGKTATLTEGRGRRVGER